MSLLGRKWKEEAAKRTETSWWQKVGERRSEADKQGETLKLDSVYSIINFVAVIREYFETNFIRKYFETLPAKLYAN